MIIVGVRFVLLLAALSLCAAAVVELGDDFDKQVGDGSVWLVEFYGPNCGHCKRLEPNYKALAQRVEQEGMNFKVGKLNAMAFSATTRQYNAYPWPSLKILKAGQVTDFQGSREMWGDDGVQRMIDQVVKTHPEAAVNKDL